MKFLRVLSVIGGLMVFAGFALFGVGFLDLMANGNDEGRFGPPPIIIWGFGTAFFGVLLTVAAGSLRYFIRRPSFEVRITRD
ncbi:hypothetical protein [Streptomyces sp. NPDC012510]|uniref:hypothetical protein n=1 Tax=Streptomyces sp. NPDC012510 TaxID=3364838 RepID=UPI0036EE960F